jgi:hypothetical protein
LPDLTTRAKRAAIDSVDLDCLDFLGGIDVLMDVWTVKVVVVDGRKGRGIETPLLYSRNHSDDQYFIT